MHRLTSQPSPMLSFDRFATGDYSLNFGFKQYTMYSTPPPTPLDAPTLLKPSPSTSLSASGAKPDVLLSYDSMCGFCKKLVARWQAYFPNECHMVRGARRIIPVVHVKNHLPECDPLYCYCFKPCTGHFHGETAEYIWPTLNALGGSVRQMSLGHRTDCLQTHYSDWNWRKQVGMGVFNLRNTL